MKTILLKNNTSNIITINSVGITISPEDTIQLNNSDLLDMSCNSELLDLINSNSIIVNDGTSDISIKDSEAYLQPVNINIFALKSHSHNKSNISDFTHDHNDLYFTKTQSSQNFASLDHNHNSLYYQKSEIYSKLDLQTSGSSSINYNNLTSVPTEFNPSSHNHIASSITDFTTQVEAVITSKKGINSGIASLDSTGKIPLNQLPSLAITNTFVVASESEMLLLSNADVGDIAIRTDLNKSFILRATGYSTLSNWQEMLSPTSSVLSVNGKIGSVIINYSDIGASPSVHTHTKSQITDFSHTHLWADIIDHPLVFTPSTHYHDDRYFTESEITSSYYTKSDIDSNIYTKTQLQTEGSSLINYNNLTSVPTEFNPSSHDHSDLYYTKEESDVRYAEKDHNHKDLYYTKSQIDSKLASIDYAFVSANDTATDITATELENLTNKSNADGLHTHSGSGSNSESLDSAYGDWGVGRTVNVDWGSVELTASQGFAPLKLTSINYTPTQWLSGGEICFTQNELFYRDSTRAKWLSMSMLNFNAGSSSSTASGYMYVHNSIQMNSNLGFCMPFDGTIIGISFSNQNSNSSGNLIVMNSGNQVSNMWFSGMSTSTMDLNADFLLNNVLEFYIDASGNQRPNKPIVSMFIRKRI